MAEAQIGTPAVTTPATPEVSTPPAATPVDVTQDTSVTTPADESDATAAEPEGEASTENVYTDFVMPEGVTLDSGLLEQAAPIFKELGLTKEAAQKLVDLHAQQVQKGIESQAESFDQLKKTWSTATQKDKEIGGDRLPEHVATARIALEKLGTPELTNLLDDFGLGNHPEIVRFMARTGRLLKEDSPGNPGSPPSGAKKDRVSILYPNS